MSLLAKLIRLLLGPRATNRFRCPGCRRSVSADGEVCAECTSTRFDDWGG